jgi:hypothetical protein
MSDNTVDKVPHGSAVVNNASFKVDNPFPGPRPFEPSERIYFFGREREKIELTSMILANRVVFLYARSGVGKTSLLNACLLPSLRGEEDFDVLPVARLGLPLPQGISPAAVKNVFVFNALRAWKRDADPESLLSQTLTDFLFDDYLQKVSALSENESVPAPRVLVFDPFEEFFTTYPERWADRKDFFLQLSAALDPEEWRSRLESAGPARAGVEPDRSLRILFALREDHLANLDSYADLLPVKPAARVRIELLRQAAALEAVEEPAKLIGKEFEEGVAGELIRKLLESRIKVTGGGVSRVEGEFVEPVQLQIICNKLFEDLRRDKRKIDSGDLLKLGDVDEPLAEYYEASISRVVAETDEKESALRNWFGHSLITPAGTRGMVFLDPDSPRSSGIQNEAVTLFKNLYLVRSENRPGGLWYELTHDRFIEPILRSNKKWRDRYTDETRQKLEGKAEKWSKGGGELLDEEELKIAENWLTTPRASELGFDPTLVTYIKSSRAELDRARLADRTHAARSLRRLAAALVVLFAIATAAAAYAWRQSKKVDAVNKELQEANKQLQKEKDAANQGKADAERAKAEAESAKGNAERAKEDTEKAQGETEEARRHIEQANQKLLAANERAEKKAAEAKAEAAKANAATARANAIIEDNNKVFVSNLTEQQDTLRKQAIRFGEVVKENDKLREDTQKLKGDIKKLRDCTERLKKDSLDPCASGQ